ncbi:MAG: FAD-dependent oxidoreductase [Deltaproteobacteria bacterium]|nr:FAD-dependent oxidoreductase [Deltaproteobacteria bacterium]
MNNPNRAHCVAVIGGATAGAEIASRLADRGVSVFVFEQNKRPYGKIEDGLPRWHEALREKEYETIDEKLTRPGVAFVPSTKIGRDVGFKALANEWGFSAVVLANGAWRDRPLPIDGADAYLGKGLVYQNPFVIAFNHAERGDLPNARYEVLPGAVIVGGGLASIDVAKIHTLELTLRELAKRGIESNVVELEVKGIPKILAGHGLTFEQLGIVPPTIYYRRRVEDMPLMSAPEDADAARIAKVEAGRKRMLEKSTEKYCFKVEPLSAPEALIVENGRLVGLRFRRTKMENGRLGMTDETFEARGPVVISSIGSIPEPIEGIAMKGELFDFKDWEIGRLEGYPTVFSVGNVVTGKGNIVASRKHATQVSEAAVEAYLGVGGEDRSAAAEARPGMPEADFTADQVLASLGNAKPPSDEQIAKLRERVAKLQRAAGYDDYKSWKEKVGAPC